jgi:hypothetical protein
MAEWAIEHFGKYGDNINTHKVRGLRGKITVFRVACPEFHFTELYTSESPSNQDC